MTSEWKRWLCLAWLLALSLPGSAATPMVAAGANFALALRSDGTVLSWGKNAYGQLGNGQAALRSVPAKVSGIDQVAAVAAGSGFTLALRSDGTLWGWGSNDSGQMGDGTTQDKAFPVSVTGISGTVTSVAAGVWHALAVTADGRLWAWGNGTNGALGTGDRGNRTEAVQVYGTPWVRAVAAGQQHSLALATDGTVWAWGDNAYGQLGNGTTAASLTPIRVSALSNIVAIRAFLWSNLALDTSGRVWAWGNGGWGSLGDGTYYDHYTPFVVTGLPPIRAITSGNTVSIAVADNGSVWVWGDNEFGEFGDSGYTSEPWPVNVTSLAGYTDFAVGDEHVMARGSGNVVRSWGRNGFGQLGTGDTADREVPTVVSGLPPIAQFAAGLTHSVAVASDGTVWAWGSDGTGELGDRAVALVNVPTNVPGLSNIVTLAAGFNHGLAVGADGSVWGWGLNNNYELGDSSRRGALTPKQITGLPAMNSAAAGDGTSFVLDRTGTVWSWGKNGTIGAVGHGSNEWYASLPDRISLSGVTAISTTYQHALAIRSDGSVWSWGNNSYGQLGDGTTTDRGTPVKVLGLSNITSVAAGTFHSLAVDRNGNVWAWGYNYSGELGDGTTTDRSTPARVPGLTGVVAVGAGVNFSLAVKLDGSVWAWGWNPSGQLGDGTTTERHSPVQVPGLSGVVAVAGRGAAGIQYSLALKSDGSVAAWGDNQHGELGDATFAKRLSPVLAVNSSVNGFLDLHTGASIQPPLGLGVPFFVAATGGIAGANASVSTTTRFNAADVGKSGAVFITAMVPAASLESVQRSTMMGRAGNLARAAAADSGYVLLQLTPTGWQQVVNGQLIPYASGVLGDQLAAQKILENTDTRNLQGAQYCVGYGTSAAEMAASGKMRTVATIPTDPNLTSAATVSCIPWNPAAGVWWNPAEGGRGFVIEQQGNSLFFGAFLYDVSGRSTWYAAGGGMTGNTFNSTLTTYAAGQTLTGAYVAPVVTGSAGDVSITFTDASHGTLTWPGGTVPIQRFDVVAGGAAMTPPAGTPETGIWWNPSESGRGFALEIQAGTMFLGGYMFDASGNPIWYLSQAAMTNATNYTGTWDQYGNGQTMTGTYKPANVVSPNVGPVTIKFADTQNATLTLPGGRTIPITRFRF